MLKGGGGIFKSAAVMVLRQDRRLLTTADITKCDLSPLLDSTISCAAIQPAQHTHCQYVSGSYLSMPSSASSRVVPFSVARALSTMCRKLKLVAFLGLRLSGSTSSARGEHLRRPWHQRCTRTSSARATTLSSQGAHPMGPRAICRKGHSLSAAGVDCCTESESCMQSVLELLHAAQQIVPACLTICGAQTSQCAAASVLHCRLCCM